MLILLLGSLILVGVSVTLVARSFGMGRTKVANTLAQIDTYGFAAPVASAATPNVARGLLDAIAAFLGAAFASRLSALKEAEIRRELMAAGLYTLTPKRFVGYRVIAGTCVSFLTLWLSLSLGYPPVVCALAAVLGGLGGWMTPIVIVRSRAERRFQEVEQELPELIDLLVVTVEAGMGFTGSMQIASTRIEGPLGDELRLAMQEQNMGLSIEESLRNMLERCETPSMRAFVRSVLQGESLGVSIGQIMRNLADEMRKRRKANAEERAQRAPIKILFPLIFLIFPAMFIVLLGPAVFAMLDAFGNG
jgi:tight adherence protein C